jgi:tetratricopeptide (TPR) repeat protein
LRFVRGEWVLVIDSDEILDTESFINQFDTLVYKRIGGIRVLIKNFIRDSGAVRKHYYPRIFRNHSNIRFIGKIHEQISESILNEGLEIIDSDIIINHYGYSLRDEEKINRNLNLLKDEVAENPADDWRKYHLGETEFTAGNFEKAFEIFSGILNSMLLSEEQNDMIKIRLGQINLRNNQFSEAVNILDFSASTLQLEGLRKYILASSYIMLKRFEDAYDLLYSSEVQLSELIGRHDLNNVKTFLDKLKEQEVF